MFSKKICAQQLSCELAQSDSKPIAKSNVLKLPKVIHFVSCIASYKKACSNNLQNSHVYKQIRSCQLQLSKQFDSRRKPF